MTQSIPSKIFSPRTRNENKLEILIKIFISFALAMDKVEYSSPGGRESNHSYVYRPSNENIKKNAYVEVIETVGVNYVRNLWKVMRGNGANEDPLIWILNADGREVVTNYSNLRKSDSSGEEAEKHFAFVPDPKGEGPYKANPGPTKYQKSLSQESLFNLAGVREMLKLMRLEQNDIDDVCNFIREKHQQPRPSGRPEKGKHSPMELI